MSELPNGINATLTSTGTTNPWTAVLSVSASAAASPGSFTIQFLESGVSPADSCSQAVQVVTPTTTTTTTTTRPPVVTTTTTTTLPPTTTTTEPLVVTTTLSAVGPTGPTDDGGLPPLLPILGLVLVVALSGVLLSLRPDQAGFAARLRAVQSGGVVSRSQYGRRRTLGQWTSDLTGVSALARRKRVKGPSVGQRVKTSSIAKTVKKTNITNPRRRAKRVSARASTRDRDSRRVPCQEVGETGPQSDQGSPARHGEVDPGAVEAIRLRGISAHLRRALRGTHNRTLGPASLE